MNKLVRKKGIKVYHERTECPDVSSIKLVNHSRYLDGCKKLDGLFVISQNLKEYFLDINVPEEKIRVVNMTVDPMRFVNLQKVHNRL